jgi:hypothetical protein
MALTWYRYFQRNGGLSQILRRQTSRFQWHLRFVDNANKMKNKNYPNVGAIPKSNFKIAK